MSLLARLFGTNPRAGTPAPDADFWYQPVGVMTPSGVRVDPDGAKKISAWYRGRDILATVLAMLPLPLLERLPNDGGARPAKSHPLYDILHDKPNGWQDSFQWRRQAMYHLIDHGNSYHRVVPGMRGLVDQLWPLDPRTVTVNQTSTGSLVYHIRDPKTGMSDTYDQPEVFHLRGASDDGLVGQGILEHARTSLGTASATESYAAQIFSRGTLNGGVITVPGILNDESSVRMARSFVTTAGEWHMPKVLEQGAAWTPNALTPEDAQMLLSRKYTVDDIARWLGVPRHMLENSDPSFGNADQFTQNFVDFSMGPWLSLFEFAINDQLVMASRKYYAQFTREALVRGDLAVRWQSHVAAVNAGIKSVDEVRAVENLNTRGGKADELRVPQNITGKAKVPEPKDEPDADADDEEEVASPRKTVPPPDSTEDSQKARSIVRASAERLLRKEVAEVQKLAVRHAGDDEAFAIAVTEFYAKHVALVSTTLQMTDACASAYCANQARQIVDSDWMAALARWSGLDYASGVAALALDEESA
jgi:HK97 family phage portal protein